jgi:hypothetical protein
MASPDAGSEFQLPQSRGSHAARGDSEHDRHSRLVRVDAQFIRPRAHRGCTGYAGGFSHGVRAGAALPLGEWCA